MSDKAMELELSPKWSTYLRGQPESGMTYQIITIVLKDGRRIERVLYCEGFVDLSGLPGFWKVPFAEQDIGSIVVTHDKSGPPRLAT
jgi:hypothetical protein